MSGLCTIGYSGRDISEFIRLLVASEVDVVCDVRSTPYSRFRPEFSRAELKRYLNATGIKYKFLGDELGARPKDRGCYENGQATYDRISAAPFFQVGLDRLRKGAASLKLALMCSEADPIECHRAILVCRHLPEMHGGIQHIGASGAVETQEMFEARLVRHHGLTPLPLIPGEHDWATAIREAYELQSSAVAYREKVWPAEELVS
jgi:uncharacterized protein (DUF488 family)